MVRDLEHPRGRDEPEKEADAVRPAPRDDTPRLRTERLEHVGFERTRHWRAALDGAANAVGEVESAAAAWPLPTRRAIGVVSPGGRMAHRVVCISRVTAAGGDVIGHLVINTDVLDVDAAVTAIVAVAKS